MGGKTENHESAPKDAAADDATTPQIAALAPMENGWRLWVTVVALCLGLLLSTLETTIIATALIPISSSLGEFDKSNWVVVSYLLTYTGFLIIFARCSDIFGRKPMWLVALFLFTTFSLACGLSQTMNQLIIFRAFQGLGGAGIYSLAMAVITEIPPPQAFGIVSGLLGAVFATSSAVGPILGGVITSNVSWRWVFLLNVPAGGAIILVALWIFPKSPVRVKISLRSFARIDWPGSVLSLAGSILLIFALEEGGTQFPWNHAIIITTISLSGVCWLAFIAVQAFLDSRYSSKWPMLPIFPASLVTHRVIAASILTAFLVGFPFMGTIIFLPQRFQLQNNLSPVDAGIRMLALLLLSAFGSGFGGFLGAKKNFSFYVLVGSIGLQLIGLGLMSTLPDTGDIPHIQYFYQAILGLGFGLALSSTIIVSRMEVDAADHAVTMGAITQVRVLGGSIGIAICQAILSSRVRHDLRQTLSKQQLADLLKSTSTIATLTPDQQRATSQAYGRGFKLQTIVLLGFAGASLLTSLLVFKRHAHSWDARDTEKQDGAPRLNAEVESPPDSPPDPGGKYS
ncbi:hypothetical protein AJ80_04078 [Polytolypa hystricis UAMH7299]|uniref:Major facilitator superfamily (MFS) profile domain-containing protein n=1 Tax=Polytolypa hystricis (strain UAMH7299) TaxID=1447883 RepID=A0A2B7YDI0_POLH7|nr:hypothetical protein AJ80_04078 [Polytolypa hystricis UAMH7299]